MAKKSLDLIALVLLIIGGLNWGLAVFDINLVTMLLSAIPYAVEVVYILVGIAAIYEIIALTKK